MSVLRTQWLKHPEFVIRAARHYIGLCQVYILHHYYIIDINQSMCITNTTNNS